MRSAGFNGGSFGLKKKGLIATQKWGCKGDKMDLRCPKCNSTDLKNVSLAYQEGAYHIDTRSRIRGLLFAGGGPDVLVGRATTRGSHQSALSKSLSPPTKWSYVKLVLWSGVVTFVALVIYVQHVMSSPVPASSLPVKLYVIFASVVLLLLAGAVWRHNHSTYRQKQAQWNESFICRRCGTVGQQSLS